jgi:tRNA-Thr(GGU) m(6)t(6)A37 methyltransferase TsaA
MNIIMPILLKSCTIVSAMIFLPTVLFDINPNPDAMKIEYCPIGEFHTNLTPQSGAPRQGILQPANKGTIEIFDEYAEALKGLDQSEYIIVLYHLHLSGNWHHNVRPPGSRKFFGLFATRSPNRPNPIGFAVIKLNRIEGALLHVSGIDAYHGTPVLDIKPWLPSIDCPVSNTSFEIESELGLAK